MSVRFARSLVLALVLCLLVPKVRAETLPLPDNLTDLNSNQGEAFFIESDALATYFPIADNFVTQKTQAYCGVASMVMVLNAAGVPAPTSPEYQPYSKPFWSLCLCPQNFVSRQQRLSGSNARSLQIKP